VARGVDDTEELQQPRYFEARRHRQAGQIEV